MVFNHRPKVLSPYGTIGSSSNLQFKAERIKIPSTPRYPRSVVGSDRGETFSGPPPCLLCHSVLMMGYLGTAYKFLVISASQETLVEPSLRPGDVRG